MIGRPPVSLTSRLASKTSIDAHTGCWLWTASTRDGYGQIRIKVDGRWTVASAHRVSYELARGPIAEGLELDHLCRVTTCINPDHLEPVTHLENIQRGILARYPRYPGGTRLAPDRGPRPCDHCGQDFTPGRRGRMPRFCSTDCRTSHHNFRRAA